MRRSIFYATAFALSMLAAATAARADKAAEMCGEDGAAAFIASDPVNFKDAYYDFDKHALAFIGSFNPEDFEDMEEPRRAERYRFLYERAEGLVVRLARLLPLSQGEGEKSPIALLEERLYAGAIWDMSDDPQEVQRTAFARELIAVAPDAGRKAGKFVVHLDMTRNLLAEGAAGKISEAGPGALIQLAPAIAESYKEGFRPTVKEAVFGSKPASLDARLAAQIEAMCDARNLEEE